MSKTNNRWTNLGDWTIQKQVAPIICEANSSIPQEFPAPPSLYKKVNVYTDPIHHAIYLKTLSQLLVIPNRSNYVSICLLYSLGNNCKKKLCKHIQCNHCFSEYFLWRLFELWTHSVNCIQVLHCYVHKTIIKRAWKVKLTWCFSKLRISCTLVPNIT